MKVEDGKDISTFEYYPDGQLAERHIKDFDVSGATAAENVESFVWDGLALISRSTLNAERGTPNGVSYTIEPHANGGSPILVSHKDAKSQSVIFNDMLGSSLGSVEDGEFREIRGTSFGENLGGSVAQCENFFTGKPQVEGLGYSFLFRNYRADVGKWQTSDPLGYYRCHSDRDLQPDGWNNLAYCGNMILTSVDICGLKELNVVFISDRTVFANASAFAASGKFDEIIVDVSGPQDLVNQIGLLTLYGDTIKSFALFGHSAGSGVATLAGEKDSTQNFHIDNFSTEQTEFIKSKLAPDAIYTSFGCGSGDDVQGLQKTANLLGIDARGFTDPIDPGPNPDYDLPTAIDFFWSWITGGPPPTNPGYHWNAAQPE